MAETIEPTIELTTTVIGPEFYVRVNLSKTSAGWRHETTASIKWRQNERIWTHPDPDERDPSDEFRVPIARDLESDIAVDDPLDKVLDRLLRIVDIAARKEMLERERIDAEKAVSS